jgi:TPR repeat protein
MGLGGRILLSVVLATGVGQSLGQSELGALLALAEAGDPEAQYSLGLVYYEGRGTARSDEEALKWFRASAERGLASAQAYVGFMYDNGRGVPENAAEAMLWYRRSAEQGVPMAQASLAYMYLEGRGAGADVQAAYVWFALAASEFRPAAAELAKLESTLSVPALEAAKALAKACLMSGPKECNP